MNALKSNITSYLRWLIAHEYYDGTMEGIGERAEDSAAVWFRVVAWDDEQWSRVFAVATVDASLIEGLVKDLQKLEPQKRPFWLPGPRSVTHQTKKGWAQIVAAAGRSVSWRLVEAHDLTDSATDRAVPAADVAQVVACVRAGRIFAASGPSLTESFLKEIYLQDG